MENDGAKKHIKKLLWFSCSMLLILFVTIISCIHYSRKNMTNYAFEILEEVTDDWADEINELLITNESLLNTMARAIDGLDFSDTEALTEILNQYKPEKYQIKIRLLTEDGMLLEQDGKWKDVSENVEFDDEVDNAPYISGRCEDFADKDCLVFNQAVPVARNGETVAILYSSMLLDETSKMYKTNDFDSNAFVLLIDGNTGEVLLDTWHTSLGNIMDYSERVFEHGDTILEAMVKMQNDESGNLAFVSKTRGKMIYLHYEPVGINNVSAVVGVKEEVALHQTSIIVKSLYVMSAIIFSVLIILMAVIVVFLIRTNRKIYLMGIVDQGTGCLNRIAYERYLTEQKKEIFSEVACIYVDVNGLHEINNKEGHASGDILLKTVSDILRKKWKASKVFRVGGDEFVVFSENTDETKCREIMEEIRDVLKKQGYSISVGFSCRKNEKGLDRVSREADVDMLRSKAGYYVKNNSTTDNR